MARRAPHPVLLVGCWLFTGRSLTQSAQTVRAHAVCPALALRHATALGAVLGAIQRCVAAGGTVAKRRRRPSVHQLLADPALGG